MTIRRYGHLAALSAFWTSAALAMLAGGCVIPLSSPLPIDGGTPGTTASLESSTPDVAPPSGSWTNVTGNLAHVQSECGNLSGMSVKPDEDMLIAGVSLKGLWSTTTDGPPWLAMGTGAGSATITNRLSSVVYDPSVPTRFWESGLYNGGGVYETTDDGKTFAVLGTIGHCDLVTVDFTDPARQTLLAGGHEQSQTLYKSTDGGMTWASIGASLPDKTNCTHPLIIDANTYLVGCGGFGGGPSGIYRSTDGGATWTPKTSSGGAASPLRASDQSIYWMSPENRGMTRSKDNGLTWTDVVGANVLQTFTPIELPGGIIAALGSNYILKSSDHGATWVPATAALPVTTGEDATGLLYSPWAKAIYIWQNTCGSTVPADAILRFPYPT